jgi:hypothetical protein
MVKRAAPEPGTGSILFFYISKKQLNTFQPLQGCGLPNIFYAIKSQPVPGWKRYFKTESGTDSILLTTAKRAAPEPGTGSIM